MYCLKFELAKTILLLKAKSKSEQAEKILSQLK